MDVCRTPEPEELLAAAEHPTTGVSAAKKARWMSAVDAMMSKFHAFVKSIRFDHPAGENIAVSWTQALINEFVIDLNQNRVTDLEVSNIMYCIEAVCTALETVHTAIIGNEETQNIDMQMSTVVPSDVHDQEDLPQELIVKSGFEAQPSVDDVEMARLCLFSKHATIYDGQMHPMARTSRIWADLLSEEISKKKITPLRLALFIDALRQIRIAGYIVEEMYRTRDHNAMLKSMEQ
jgi:hypothetical protein